MDKRILIPVLIILVMLSFFVGSYFFEMATGGLTIMSIDSVNILRAGEVNPEGYFRITVAADRGSETIRAYITPGDFESFTHDTEYKVQDTVRITLTDLKEIARYQVDNTGMEPIYSLYRQRSTLSCNEISWKTSFHITSLHPGLWWVTLCVGTKQSAVYGDLNLPSIDSEVTLSVGGIDKSDEIIISGDQKTKHFPRGIGSAKWVGGLVTGAQLPDPEDYIPYYDKSGKLWKLARPSSIIRYEADISSIERDLNRHVQNAYTDFDIVEGEIDNYNNEIFSLLKEDRTFNEDFKWINREKEIGDVFLDYEVPIESLTPVVVITLKATAVDIEVTVGKPKILEVSSPEFNSGDKEGRINVKIRNDADYPGSFDVSLEECGKFSQSYSIVGQQFRPHEERTITIPIRTLGLAVDTKETCLVEVCDESMFGTCDTMAVDIHMLEARYCTEGAQMIEGSCIEQCINNEWVTQKCCEFGIGFEDDEYFCKTREGEKAVDLWEFLMSILIFILIIIIIVVVAVVAIKVYLSRRKK